ncbi:AI-2E family transporter [Luteococcus peritonei]|uniref:AI-2E family transporter n=1 Tax=Luteococcus peritonei TaxID=88874 RepID=A0ABW4RTV3_9ACTN
MFDRLRRRRRPSVDQTPDGGVLIGPETPQEAAARVTDPTARSRVVVQETPQPATPTTPVPAPHGPSAAGRSGLPRFVMVALCLAAAVVLLIQLHELASIVAPLFFALNLMITAYPLQRFLVRKGAPAWLGSVLAGLAVLLVLGLMLFGLAYSVAAMVGELPTYTNEFTNLYNQTLQQLTRLGFDEGVLVQQLKGIDPNSIINVVTGVLSNASGVATLAVVVLTTLIFMVMDSMNIEQRLAAARAQHPSFVEGLQNFAQGIRKYWMVTTLFGLIVAVVDYGILVGVGVPLALVWAMFSFLTNYIPNIGFVVGLIPPALLALVEGGWKPAVFVVVGYSVVNFIIQSILQPRVAGDAVGLTPTLSFASLLLWGWVFGGLGALIALPLSLLVKALLVDIDPQARWVNTLVSSRISDGVEEPETSTPQSM